MLMLLRIPIQTTMYWLRFETITMLCCGLSVGIYGWSGASNKHLTWPLMKEARSSCSSPMIFFGDFNEILHASKKDGGAVRRECIMDAFRVTI